MRSDPEAAMRVLTSTHTRVLRSEFNNDATRALVDRSFEIARSTQSLISRSDMVIERFRTLGRASTNR